MKPGSSRIAILSVAIIVGFSAITIPHTNILNDKNKELAPESKISIQPGILAEIDSVRIFRTNSQAANIIAGSQDQEVDGTLSEDGGAYFFQPHGNFSTDSFYRVEVSSHSQSPLLNLLGIRNENKLVFKTWTTPKVNKFEVISPDQIDITGGSADIDYPVARIRITFDRPMNPQKTIIESNDGQITEKVEWSKSRKSVVFSVLVLSEDQQNYQSITVKEGSLDLENHPLQSGSMVSLRCSKGLESFRQAEIYELDQNNKMVYLPATVEWFSTGMSGTLEGKAWGEGSTDPPGSWGSTRPDGTGYVLQEWQGHPPLLPGAPTGALIGKSGEYGVPIVLGSKFRINTGSKPLYISFHDVKGAFYDNSGGYFIKLHRK